MEVAEPDRGSAVASDPGEDSTDDSHMTSSGATPGATAAAGSPSDHTDEGESAGPSATESPGRRLFVDSKRVDCEGEGPMQCLRIRKRPTDGWELLYQGIEGFTFEEGHRYELRVAEHRVDNPQVGESSRRLKLIAIVSKKETD